MLYLTLAQGPGMKSLFSWGMAQADICSLVLIFYDIPEQGSWNSALTSLVY